MHTYTHFNQTSSVAIVTPTLSRQALSVPWSAFCFGEGDGRDGRMACSRAVRPVISDQGVGRLPRAAP